jgi:hypothetical protein
MNLRILVAAVALTLVAACDSGDEEVLRFSEHGIALQAPETWSISGFSTNVWPRRLVAASYEVGRADVAGDCGGWAAVRRLPDYGAYVVVIDYGEGPDREGFTDRLPLRLSEGELAEYECFGRSHMFRFLVDGRTLQAHVGIGSDATADRREEALDVLNSIVVEEK